MTPPIRTDRLDLVAGTTSVLEAELRGHPELSGVLGVEIPESWPPPLYDVDAIDWMLGCLEDRPECVDWGFRYFVRRGETGDTPLLIGAGGFKGPPEEGAVEIGYSVVPEFQRQGFAAEAVLGLVGRAFEDPAVDRVFAETLPDLHASIGVLRSCGFRLTGEGSEPGAVRFEYRRSARP